MIPPIPSFDPKVRWIAVVAIGWLAAGAAASAVHADPAPTHDYVVQAGDSCVTIAERELGDRALYVKLHELNPGLGKLPHNLVPGSILKLPGLAAPIAPDATLTGSHGSVRVRKPELDSWDPAKLGMALFRAWRVNAQTRSSAEVTFRDTSRLVMRENTIVIIFGASAPRTTVLPAEAVLESGGLEARLDAASRRNLVVRTPSSESRLGAGHSLVTVDPGGVSIVANHGGAPIAVRSIDARRQASGPSVAVAAGMGSKVKPQTPPAPPRQLPPAPAWTTGPDRFIDLGGAGAAIAMQWAAVPDALRYRIEVLAADGTELTSAEVPAAVTAFEAYHLAPGAYLAHVSTIDTEGFESVRSLDRTFQVVTAAVFPPGSSTQLAAASAPSAPSAPSTLSTPATTTPGDAGPDLTTPAAPLKLAAGSRVVAGDGMTCGLGDAAPGPEITLTSLGDVSFRCVAADGTPTAPVAATIAPIRITATPAGATDHTATGRTTAGISRRAPTHILVTIASDAAFGTALIVRGSDELRVVSTTPGDGVIDVVVEATGRGSDRGRLVVAAGEAEIGSVDVAIEPREIVTAAPRPSRPRLELGAYTGYHLYRTNERTGAALGAPADPANVIGPGPAVGVRAGYWILPRLGLEAEAGIVAGSWASTAGHSAIATWRAHADLTFFDHDGLALHLVLGAGADSLIRTVPGTRRDTVMVIDRGIRITGNAGGGLRWSLEARDDIDPSREGGLADVLSIRVGFLRRF